MARQFWPNQDPLSKRLKLGSEDDPNEPWLNIIGIVADVKKNDMEKTSGEATMYTSYLQMPTPYSAFVIRSHVGFGSLIKPISETIQSIDREQPIANVRPMEQIVSVSFAGRQFTMFLLGIFAAIAVLLAAVGMYGVMAYMVTQRTTEIGIRMALGARTLDVLKMIIRQGMFITVIGIAIGLVGGFVLTRLMKSLLFGVSPTDPLTFAGVAILLALVALFACYIPARRATKVDPLVALRYE
jgi:putative ABC transport system permease protein